MRVTVTNPTDSTYPAEMLLTPETDIDQETLERLMKHYQTVGFGRYSETWKLNHVRVRLVPATDEGGE